jgi:hypothetical protein
LTFVPKEGEDMGEIACVIHGLWRDCILYEVPIMSISKPAPWFLLTRADDKMQSRPCLPPPWAQRSIGPAPWGSTESRRGSRDTCQERSSLSDSIKLIPFRTGDCQVDRRRARRACESLSVLFGHAREKSIWGDRLVNLMVTTASWK